MNCLFPDSYMFATWFASGEKSPGGIKSLHLYERHLIFLLFFHCTFTLLKSCLSLQQIILIIENRMFFFNLIDHQKTFWVPFSNFLLRQECIGKLLIVMDKSSYNVF